jgi:hypothetical protein
MPREPSSKDPKAKTPAKITGPKDARHHEKAGRYPNYYAHKTRSGHVFMMDDSKMGEHITLQHRSGSMVQFLPDGCVQFVSHNGRYQFTFGEDRIMVTGAQDIVVQGAASLRVEKDYNLTVMGDMNTTVDGNYNITAKNFNADIGGNIDIVSQNMTVKTKGAMEYSAHQTATFAGDQGVAISSTDGSIGVVAKKDLGLKSYDKFLIDSDGRIDIKGDSAIRITAEVKLSLKSVGSIVAIDGDFTYIQSGMSDGAEIEKIVLTEPEDANTDRVRNAEISRVHVAEDNGIDAEILNTTFEKEDDLESDKDDTDYEPAQAPLKGVIPLD